MSVAVLLGGVIPYVLQIPWFSPSDSTVVPLQLLLLGSASLLGLLIGSASRNFNLFTFTLFVYLFGALAPMAQIDEGRFYWPGSYTADQIVGASIVTILGTSAWGAGYFLSATRPIRPPRFHVSTRSLRQLSVVGVVASVLAALLFGLGASVGSRSDLTGPSSLAGADSAVRELVRGSVIALVAVPTIGLLSRRRESGSTSRRYVWLLAFALLVIVNPITNARFVFGAVAIALLIVVVLPTNPNRTRLLLLSFLTGMLVVFPIADSFRYEFGAVEDVRFDRDLLLSGDYDAFQQTMNVIAFVDRDGLQVGKQISGSILVGVPRSLWESKPTPTGPLVAEAAGYRFTNLSSPLWSEGYVDLGYVGVVFLCAAFGAVSAFADRRFKAEPSSLAGLLAPLLAGYQIILLRGSLMGVSSVLIISVVVATVASTRTARRPAGRTSRRPAGI